MLLAKRMPHTVSNRLVATFDHRKNMDGVVSLSRPRLMLPKQTLFIRKDHIS
jgi:hypothetical protein